MEQKSAEQNVENMELGETKPEMMEVSGVDVANNEDGERNFRAIWDQDDGEIAVQAGMKSDGTHKEYNQLSDDEWIARIQRVQAVTKTMQEFKTAYGIALEMIRNADKTIRLIKLRKAPTEAVAGILAEVEARQGLRVLTWAKEAPEMSANTGGVQSAVSDVWLLLDKRGKTFHVTEGKRQITYTAVGDYEAYSGVVELREEWSMYTGRAECVAYVAGIHPSMGAAVANWELRSVLEHMVGSNDVARDTMMNCRFRQVGEGKEDMVYELQARSQQHAKQMSDFLMEDADKMEIRRKKRETKLVCWKGKQIHFTDSRQHALIVGREMKEMTKTKKKSRDRCTVMVSYPQEEGKVVNQVRAQDVQAAVDGLNMGICVSEVLPTRERMGCNEFSIVVNSSGEADKLAAHGRQVGEQIWQIKDEAGLKMWKKRMHGQSFSWKSDGGSGKSDVGSDSSGDESLRPDETKDIMEALKQHKKEEDGTAAYAKALNLPSAGRSIKVQVSRSVHRSTGRGKGGRGQEDRVGNAKGNARGRGGGGSPAPETEVEKKLDALSDMVEGLVVKIKEIHDGSAMDVADESIPEATVGGANIEQATAKAVDVQGKAHKQELAAVTKRAREAEDVLFTTNEKLNEVQSKLAEAEKNAKSMERELRWKSDEIAVKDTEIMTLRDQVAVLTGEVESMKEETKGRLETMEEKSKQQHKNLQKALDYTKKQLVEKDRVMADTKQAQDTINEKNAEQMNKMIARLDEMQKSKEQPIGEEWESKEQKIGGYGWEVQRPKVNTPTRERGGGGKSAKRALWIEGVPRGQAGAPADGSGQMDEEVAQGSEQMVEMRIGELSAGSCKMDEEVANACAFLYDSVRFPIPEASEDEEKDDTTAAFSAEFSWWNRPSQRQDRYTGRPEMEIYVEERCPELGAAVANWELQGKKWATLSESNPSNA